MYSEIEEQMQPLVYACSETLMRYRHLCHQDIIMDGNIIEEGCIETMLSAGLGKYFAKKEKQNLFNDANEISKLLIEVMNRKTRELEQGIDSIPQSIISKIQPTQSTNKGLEALGLKRESIDEFSVFDNKIAGLNRLKPSDLPRGVVAKRGYDHRGHCYAFEHVMLGDLGKIVLTDTEDGQTLMEADLCNGNSEVLPEKQKVFEEIISIVERRFRDATTAT